MKLSDYQNEEAIDLLADILEPVARILGDRQIATAVRGHSNKITVAKLALKNHKKDVIEVLARMDGKEVKDYVCNPITITMSLLELLNDEALADFFLSQGQAKAQESSIPVTANTEAVEQ